MALVVDRVSPMTAASNICFWASFSSRLNAGCCIHPHSVRSEMPIDFAAARMVGFDSKAATAFCCRGVSPPSAKADTRVSRSGRKFRNDPAL